VSPTRRLVYTLGAIWLVVSIIGIVIMIVLPFPPGPASNVSQSVTDTIRLLAYAAWPVFSLTIIAIVGAVMVHRRDPDVPLASARALRGSPRLAMTWIGVTGAIVLVLAIIGTITLSNDDVAQTLGLGGGRTVSGSTVTGGTVEAATTLEVQVIAQQWQFTYRYPSLGGIESAHLVLPVNTSVTFHITSLDVNHSFWLIALGVKADAVPLHDNIFYATTQSTGTYRVECGELCGLWHGAMSDNQVQVVSASDFSAWSQQQTALDAPIMKYLPPYAYVYEPSPSVYG
jgi:cytochrome c oxidase subunit 2